MFGFSIGFLLGSTYLTQPSSSVVDPDAEAYMARMSTVPTTEQVSAYDYFVKQAKAIGAWSYITDCGFLCAQDAASTRLGVKNIINPAIVGTAGEHYPGYGVRFNGTNQALNTSYKFPAGQQDNAHMGLYSLSPGASNASDMGNANSAINCRSLGTADTAFMRVNGVSAGSTTSLDGVGFFLANRTGPLSTDNKLFKRGVVAMASTSSSALPDSTYNIWIGGRNGATPEYSSRNLAFWSIGTGMPDAVALAYSLLVENVCARLSASYTAANVTDKTRALYRYMTRMSRQPSYVFGAFDNAWWALGTTPNLLADISTITGGKVPALIAHDFADPLSIGGAAGSAAQIARIKAHYEAGGINTVQMHPGNPVTGAFEQLPSLAGTAGNQYDMTGNPVVACLTGGAKRAEFLAYTDRIIAFLQACTDSSGAPIPIILRPFHEINGGFFWWTDPTPANTIQLWRDFVDRIKAAGVQNVLYSWNNNFAPTPSATSYFPGLAYVDLLSVDYYDNVASPTGLSASESVLSGLTSSTFRRPTYYGEIGFQGAADSNSGLWNTKVGGYHRDRLSRSSSFLLWRSPFGPSAGGATNSEFVAMVSDTACITRDRLVDVYTTTPSAPPAPDVTAPTITSANPSGTYAENTPISGTLTANEAVTWSKSGTDQALITLNSSTGTWSITATPDFETKASYSWTFTATDGAGNATHQVVAVTITDVVEGGDTAISSLFAGGEQGVWFDPSDITTMFQDTAGTVPVTAAGQSVARINDKSGRGNHATQATAGSRPTYQVDGARGYLLFDGTDDFMVTPSINPASNKSQIFAGVRKLSDAASSIVIELGTGASASINSSYLQAPSATGANSYRFGHGGSGVQVAGTGAFAAAPNTSVLTGLGDIAGNSSQLRRNGAVVETNTASQGTGTLQTNAVYLGARAGTSLRFNGRLYGAAFRFGANLTGTQVSDAEAWMNTKTGAY